MRVLMYRLEWSTFDCWTSLNCYHDWYYREPFQLSGQWVFVDGCATRMNNKWLSVMQSKYGTSQPSVLSSALGIGFSTFVNKSLHEHEHQYKYYYYYIICLKWHLAILTGQKPMTPFTNFYMKSIIQCHQMKSFVASFPYKT